MTAVKEVQLSELFTLHNGSAKHVRAWVDSHPGPYPVYSAALTKPFGFIDSFDYSGHHLTWVMNGYGGSVQEVDGAFSINRDRGILVARSGSPKPDLTFVRASVEPRLRELAVGRRVDGRKNEYTKIYPEVAATAWIDLPIANDGQLDYAYMSLVGERIRAIDQAKVRVRTALAEVDRAHLPFKSGSPSAPISLGSTDHFRLSIGTRRLSTEVSKSGDIAIYSANVRQPFGYASATTQKDFTKASLIWGIDGIFDWSLRGAGEQFEITDHCGRLEFVSEELDPLYVLYALRTSRDQYGFDRVYRANLRNVASSVVIDVPVAPTGSFDLERQRELATNYEAYYETRTRVLETLRSVASTDLDPVFDEQ